MDTSKSTDLTCNICQKDFKQRKNLLRHQRTVHGDKTIICDTCGAKFNRLDNLTQHKKTHSGKRKASETDAGPSKRQRLDHEDKCNYCGQVKNLSDNKPFCDQCRSKGRECSKCHRPLPERFYTHSVENCNACHKKNQNGGSGGSKNSALDDTVSTTTIKPEVKLDLLAMLADEEVTIRNSLGEDINQRKGIKWYITVTINFSKMDSDGK